MNSLNSVEIQSEKYSPELDKQVDLAIDVFDKHKPEKLENTEYSGGFTLLFSIRNHRLRQQQQSEKALKLLKRILSISKDYWENDVDNEFALLFYLQMLQSAINNEAGNTELKDQYATEHDRVVTRAAEKHPASIPIASQYFLAKSRSLATVIRDDPKQAKAMYDETMATMKRLKESQPTNKILNRRIMEIQQNEAKIAAAMTIENLIGNTAPKLDIEAWINGDSISLEKLAGKVVLLNFFAAWSRPSIENISDLQQLRSAFSDSEFKIIGVTNQGDFVWDNVLHQPSPSTQPLSLAECSKELKKFASDLNVLYPIAILHKDSGVGKEYGVTSIPHFVLLDKSGKIRQCLTGPETRQTDRLKESIQNLLDE